MQHDNMFYILGVHRSLSLSPASTTVTTLTPLCQSIAILLEEGNLMVEKGWLMSSKTSVSVDNLPQWMGQFPLKSVVIERVSVLCS